MTKLGPADELRACYEAGPTGYVVYWQLAQLGVECEVVAPTLVHENLRAIDVQLTPADLREIETALSLKSRWTVAG